MAMKVRERIPAGVSTPCCPYCGALVEEDLGGFEWETTGPTRLSFSRWCRRWFRRLRRIAATMIALCLLAGIILAGLLIVTPSVGNAPSLAHALDATHHAVYPGPPVPERFAAALVATEDHRFYSEAGIDPIAIARVGVGYVTGKPDQGGATIYQQLARMLYEPGHPGVVGTAEEVLLGIKLAVSYPKTTILQMYADVAYFGHGYYGLAAASCGYFAEPPAALSWPQAALLAGLLQAPSADDPLVHPGAARARQAHVLGRLAATGTLTRAQAERSYRQPLTLAKGRGARCAAGRAQ
jgi:membrane peptidoglycan carboxypeptidase